MQTGRKLATLIIEDSQSDAELLAHELMLGGYEVVSERVATAADMAAALNRRSWDLVISDSSMPGFDGRAALQMLQERRLDVPFISVSGRTDEQSAISMLKAGAHDFLTKDNLSRLVPTVQRELEAAELRRRKRSVYDSMALLASIVESSEDAIVSKTLEGIVLSWNRAAEEMYGYTALEMVGQPVARLIPPDRSQELDGIFEKLRRGERIQRYETVRVRKDGRQIPVSITISPVKDADGLVIGAASIARDITERKREEAERIQLIQELTDSLQEVKHLSGLLPICAACKKIRDDHGYWKSVEIYIREHSDAEFSHSICPECMERLYPDVHKKA